MRTSHLPFVVLILSFSALSQSVCAAAEVEAYTGEPFGVGKLTVSVLRGEAAIPLSDERFTVAEAGGRVMYPVLKDAPVRRIVRELLDMAAPRQVTLYFLFRGSEPFDLSAYTPVEQGVRVKPVANDSAHRQLLAEWWDQYSGRALRLGGNRDYPPVAENFLAASLGRRLGLEHPIAKPGWFNWSSHGSLVFQRLFVDENRLLGVDRSMMLTEGPSDHELEPLPAEPKWEPVDYPAKELEGVAVAPIAQHVPEECFYMHFGSFNNYRWFRDWNRMWQGELGNMLLQRGIDREAKRRIEQQLALHDTALAKILGPQFVADVGIVGLDPYTAQGAAIGLVFQERNTLFGSDLVRQRRQALTEFADATESTVQIAGRDVSLIATPHGEVRSYYVSVDGFHLVATSPTLVRRFIEAGEGERSLASLSSFRHARQQFPLDQDETVFVFVSEKFSQQLCTPQVQIELARRLQSIREPRLLEMARLAAKVEGSDAQTRKQLVASGVLPEGFGRRVDGSELIGTDAGLVDSRRGAPGYFLPVADVPVEQVSAAEAEAYRKFLKDYREFVGQVPPMVAVLRKTDAADGTKSITSEFRIEPLAGLKQQLIPLKLGAPSSEQLAPVEGDLIAAEVVLDTKVPILGGDTEPHHLFGGLRDYRSPLAVERGELRPRVVNTELFRGYLGAWPRPGLLKMLVNENDPPPPAAEQLADDLWQAGRDDFLLISFKQDVVDEVLPQLAMIPAEREAQIRLRIADFTGTEFSQTLNAIGYMRTRDASVAASRLMNSLANQLHVPRAKCRELAERLVDGKCVCPLGGEYQLYAPERGLEVWISSALPDANRFLLTEIPPDYHLPLLGWFRGLQGDMALTDDYCRGHFEVEVTAEAVP